MKELSLEKMQKVNGGWELVCDLVWGFEITGDDFFFGHYEVTNCRFV